MALRPFLTNPDAPALTGRPRVTRQARLFPLFKP
jgi:hypothetical protein